MHRTPNTNQRLRSRTSNAINVLGYTKNSRVSFANRVSKMKKKQESLLLALIERDMLLVANCCTRIFVSVISSRHCIKRLSKFSVQFLRDMCLYNQEYRSPLKHYTQMYSDCVPGGGYSLIQAIQVCAAPKGMLFQPFWSKKGYQFRPVWSRYVFLDEATSSSIGDETISIGVLGQSSTFRNSTVLYPTK